jgi:LPS-assembly lipoprotein
MWFCKTVTLILVVGIFQAAGCGFKPLYRTSGVEKDVVNQFSLIQIAPIKNRVGQQLRNILQDKITPKGTPRNPVYRLIVTLRETRDNLVILKNATSTFAKIRLRASFKLMNVSSKRSVVNGAATSIAVFNISESEYANIKAEASAKSHAAEEISEVIRTRLALFFRIPPR